MKLTATFIFCCIAAIVYSCAPSTFKPVQKINRDNLSRDIPFDRPLTVDDRVILGTLDNGVRYYIRENHKPQNRAQLHLVVNAGSILEDDDQQGLAHLVEHMAFNGTAHFEKQELVDYLESIGMRFGPELNAYTSFDETVYMLQVPTDSTGLVETAFQILEDWAHGMSLDADEIDKERKVVHEEWRLGRGAEARMQDIQFPVLFEGSLYAERLPIGKMAVVDTASYDTVRRYYRDWYRPDQIAVIAVGDFETTWIEDLVKKYFDRIPVPETIRKRPVVPVPEHEETLVATASDPEATGSSVAIYYKQPKRKTVTAGDYRQRIIERLYNGLLNRRFEELTRQPDAPFLVGYSYLARYIRSCEIYILRAAVKDNGIQRGLEALLTEAERVEEFGFTPTELEREKKQLLRTMERSFEERDKTDSRRFAFQYTRHFLDERPIPGIEMEFELYRALLPEIELDEVNTLAKEWLVDRNRVIMVNAPEKEGILLPDENALLSIFDVVDQKEIGPYMDDFSDKPLLAYVPDPAEILRENSMEELGIRILQLSNGARVILKPTDFKNDEILFIAYSPGGHSLIDEDDHMSGESAADIIDESGAGDFDLIELQKHLAGKTLYVRPFIEELQEGMRGSCSPRDMESMFQLIYLYFTSPRCDSTAFLAYREKLRGFIENRSASPVNAFRDTVKVTMAQYHHRARPLTLGRLAEIDLDEACRFYRERFADGGDFTFLFVGAFEYDEIEPLILQYIGGLPAIHRDETWRDIGVTPPAGIVEKQVRKGMEPKSLTQIVFTGPFQWNRRNRYEMQSMAEVFRIKLREILREDLGGTYGIWIRATPLKYPRERYRFTLYFGSDPARADELVETIFEQIDSLSTAGTTDKYLQKVKETQRREYEKNLKENKYWLETLKFYDFHGEDLRNILTFEEFVESLSLDALKGAARNYLDRSNYVRVTLYPEQYGDE
jgi:zinc protease